MFFSSITLSLYSNNKIDGDRKIKAKIGQYIYFPDFLKSNKKSTTVIVDFSIDKDGKLIINNINGDPKLHEFVVEQLNKIKFKKDTAIIGKNYLYKINFKSNHFHQ